MKDIVQIGACIGREFSYELLACISTLRDEQLEEALEKLTEAGLVYRRGTPPDATYTFKHALVQDAAYDSLLKSRRAQLHAQIAQVLEEDFAERVANEPELLAHHYTQAGNLAAAIPLWQKAGELALRRVALQGGRWPLPEGLGPDRATAAFAGARRARAVDPGAAQPRMDWVARLGSARGGCQRRGDPRAGQEPG